jgi:hypothetical protein
MADNIQLIQKHSSMLSIEKSPFENPKKEVASMIQSNMDLVTEYLELKTRIERTNNSVVIEIEGQVRTITEWLTMYRKLRGVISGTYMALTTNEAQNKLNRMSAMKDEIQILPLYDETEKITALRKREDIMNSVESRLEIINATTDLV